MEQYDAMIIGFGKGRKLLVAKLTSRSWRVTIIERSSQMYGGAYVNAGCTPTRTLIHESEQAEWFYRDNCDSQARLYTSAVGRKNKLISFLRDKDHEHLKGHPNITLYDGETSFMSDDTAKAAHDKGEALLQEKEIFINTSFIPILPDVEGLNGSKHAPTSEALLRQNVLPEHLLILGVGIIGVELATVYAGSGNKATLLESGNRFIPKSDRDMAKSMLGVPKKEGTEVWPSVHALFVYDTADGMTLTYVDNSDDTSYFLEGDILLLATGRGAMTDGLNLHAADVQTNTQGAIIVNGHLQTILPHIWAMEDIRGDAMYDYLPTDSLRVITSHLFDDKKRSMNDRLPMPYIIFTGPPLARIGTTEEEAVKCGYSVQVSRPSAIAIPRAHILQHVDGTLEVIVNAHTGRIMGCALFCVDAPGVINLVALTIKNDLHYSVLRDFIFTRLSMNEGLNDLFKAF